MNKGRVVFWFICLIVILILFNMSFRMVYTPAGIMGGITTANIIASYIYLSIWLILAVFSGIKRRKDIFVAGLIFSGLPAVGFLSLNFSGTPIAYLGMLLFCSMVPIQGIFAANEQLIFSATIVLMPAILLLGYYTPQKIKWIKN